MAIVIKKHPLIPVEVTTPTSVKPMVVKKVSIKALKQPSPLANVPSQMVPQAATKPSTKKVSVEEESYEGVDKYAYQAVTGEVEKGYQDGSLVSSSEEVGQVLAPANPALVSVSMGITRNLGNYESFRFNVTITMPCSPTAEDIEETYEQCKGWCDGKANELNEEMSLTLGKA